MLRRDFWIKKHFRKLMHTSDFDQLQYLVNQNGLYY